MKMICIPSFVGLVSAIFIFNSITCDTSDSDVEREIRKLDLEEAEAIQKKDVEWFSRLVSDNFVVNSPRNEIIRGRDAVAALFSNGVINYRSLDRQIESVSLHRETAIVMGHESVVTEDQQTINRRYTNIWVKQNGRWLLTARHASVICPS